MSLNHFLSNQFVRNVLHPVTFFHSPVWLSCSVNHQLAVCVCVSQWDSWLHGSRGPSEGNGVRQQRRLVLFRLHALQTPQRVKSSSFPRCSPPPPLPCSPLPPHPDVLSALKPLLALCVSLFEYAHFPFSPSSSHPPAFCLVCVWSCLYMRASVCVCLI